MPTSSTTPAGVVLSSGCTSSPVPGRDGVMGAHGNALKLRVQAPAVSGKANEAVLRLLAREFGSPPASLSLTAGEYVEGQAGAVRRRACR
jgi:uncharacterized protein YggU (UPF0235/DUF167 family)